MPRLFVYHSENKNNKDFVKVAKIQEHKLLYIITIPAMWITIISGALMLYVNDVFIYQIWMIIKFIFIAILLGFTYSLKYYFEQFKNDKCNKSGKFFRIYNEIPTIAMIAIVIMVMIKPSF